MLALIRTLLSAQIFATQATRLRTNIYHVIIRAIITLAVTLLILTAAGFFTTAVYILLVRIYDVVHALLIISGGYLALALVVYSIAMLSFRSSNFARNKGSEKDAINRADEIIEKINPLDLAQKGGQALTEKVGPLPLVAIAIFAGYLLAHRREK